MWKRKMKNDDERTGLLYIWDCHLSRRRRPLPPMPPSSSCHSPLECDRTIAVVVCHASVIGSLNLSIIIAVVVVVIVCSSLFSFSVFHYWDAAVCSTSNLQNDGKDWKQHGSSWMWARVCTRVYSLHMPAIQSRVEYSKWKIHFHLPLARINEHTHTRITSHKWLYHHRRRTITLLLLIPLLLLLENKKYFHVDDRM